MTRSEVRHIREVRIAPADVQVRRTADGTVYLQSRRPLGPYAVRITDALDRWAGDAPDRTFLAERDANGEWRRITYRDAHARVRGLAQALLDRDLSPDRPILILSGNSIDHGLLALAAMYVGVPYAPIAPAYSPAGKGLRHPAAGIRPHAPRPRLRRRRRAIRTAAARGAASDAELGAPAPSGGLGATRSRRSRRCRHRDV